MKTQLMMLLSALLLISNPAWAQIQPPLITVSGSAEIKVAPDEIVLSVGARTRNSNLSIAARSADEIVARAIRFLKKQGVNEKDIQTDVISIHPEFNATSPGNPADISQYDVSKGLVIRLTNVTNVELVMGGLISSGVNEVGGIQLRTSELRKHRDEARVLALRSAKEKALDMAKEAGVKLGKIYTLNATDGGGWVAVPGGPGNNAMMSNVRADGDGGEPAGAFSAGQISVSAEVTASFLIE